MIVFGAGKVAEGREVFVVEENAIELQGQVREDETDGKEFATRHSFGRTRIAEPSTENTGDERKRCTDQNIHDGVMK